ncbi:MAG: thioredoxin-dependent thiol peroxidase [Pirellula sp.]|nr:thioredoxin-dependent thiol peroxidase [Pirellula sp.]
MSKWLTVGKQIPNLTLAADDGGQVHLPDLRGKTVVLYFYPKDDTPGCTREACAFRDRSTELKKLGVAVYGVSPDNVKSHGKFRDKFSLNFPLLADTDHAAAEAFGAWQEKSMYGRKYMGIQRSTFLFDAEGKLRNVWEKVNVDGHDSEVIDAVKALSGAAPAKAAKPVKKKPAAKKAAAAPSAAVNKKKTAKKLGG